MNVLVACEESQRVTKCFRKRGHNAFSCDLIECSGGHPEWHIKVDVLTVLSGHTSFVTQNNTSHTIDSWDLIIAHPPCTYITCTGNRWYKEEYKEKYPNRQQQREEAIEFFMEFVKCNCDKIAIENPVGIMSTVYRKPDQYIEPYMFGDPYRKKTCLWLKNLGKLEPTEIVEPEIIYTGDGKSESIDHYLTASLPMEERSKIRSKTYWGIAKAMAEQWG